MPTRHTAPARRALARGVIAIGLITFGSHASGRPVGPTPRSELQNLTPADGAVMDNFGKAVAADAATVLVGAPSHYSTPTGPGSVYVFERGTSGSLVLHSRVFGTGAASGDEFGASLDIDGLTFIAGSPFSDDRGDHTGAAYIFQRTGAGWVQRQRLLPATVAEPHRFGTAVAIDGELAAASAPTDGAGGSIYLYRRNAQGMWVQTARLSAPPGISGLGQHIALDGGRLVATCFEAPFAPACCVFAIDAAGQGVFETVLHIWDPQMGAYPQGVAVSGNVVALGATSFAADRVYLFDRSLQGAFSQVQSLESGEVDGNFGVSVALQGSTLAVGAPHDHPSGAAYLYNRRGGQWVLRSKFFPRALGHNDNIGRAIALSGGQVVVGAPAADWHGSSSGAGYLFGSPIATPAAIGL